MPRYDRTGEFLFRDGIQVAHFEDWQIAEGVVLDLCTSAETIEHQAGEIEKLRKALRQVIEDCDDAGNLSYASTTAKVALGQLGVGAMLNRVSDPQKV